MEVIGKVVSDQNSTVEVTSLMENTPRPDDDRYDEEGYDEYGDMAVDDYNFSEASERAEELGLFIEEFHSPDEKHRFYYDVCGHYFTSVYRDVCGPNAERPVCRTCKRYFEENLEYFGLKLLEPFTSQIEPHTYECSEGHVFTIEFKPGKPMRCPGCWLGGDADTLYLWRTMRRHQGLPIYKVGVTSRAAEKDRISEVARLGGFEIVNSISVYVGKGKALEPEKLMLAQGIDPGFDASINGHTEFRAFGHPELMTVLEIMNKYEQSEDNR